MVLMDLRTQSRLTGYRLLEYTISLSCCGSSSVWLGLVDEVGTYYSTNQYK